jgi:hypothetical protein
MHQKAARLIRAVGNLQGRGRMRPDISLRPAKPPRALVLSTGEDTPAGQSIRARMLVCEADAKDVNWSILDAAQQDARDGQYALAMAAYIQWLASRYEEEIERFRRESSELRDAAHRDGAHRRTTWIVAELGAALKVFLRFAVAVEALAEPEAVVLGKDLWRALRDAATAQAEQQRAEDAVERFLALLNGALGSGTVHLRDADKPDKDPENAHAYGWRPRRDGALEPYGRQIGWLDANGVYLLPEITFGELQRLAIAQGAGFPCIARTLWRRLDQRGLIVNRDTTEQRFTTKLGVGNARHRVIHLDRKALTHIDFSGASGASGAKIPTN